MVNINVCWKDAVSDKISFCIAVALVLYALTTPCPHTLGLTQLVVALCLAASVFFVKPRLIFGAQPIGNKNTYAVMGGLAQMAAIMFFITAMCGALIRMSGELTLWMLGRDILPYFFLVLPLLFLNMGKETASRLTAIIPLAVSFVGIVYSLRFISSVLEQAGSIPLYLGDQIKAYSCGCLQYRVSRDAYCFPFDPAVQFSAVYLVLRAVNEISLANKSSLFKGSMLIILGVSPVMAMCLLLNRAMLGLLVIALVFYCARSMKRFLAAIVVASALTVVMVSAATIITISSNTTSTVTQDTTAAVKEDATTLQNALLQKQKLMGFNNKTGELISLYQNLSQNSSSLIFGLGWGGRFYSPAVGQIASFTHSLLSYAVLKAGLLGLFLMVVYGVWFGHTYFKIGKESRHKFAAELYAVNCVVLISLFFQPTYKTPTYGVLLLFILAVYIAVNKRESNDVE